MKEDYLRKVLKSYEKYFEVEGGEKKLASATFYHLSGEKYILIKRINAVVRGVDGRICFTTDEIETKKDFLEIAENVLKGFIEDVKGQRADTVPDITLVIINNTFSREVLVSINKFKGSKKLMGDFNALVNFRIVAIDITAREVSTNEKGEQVKEFYEEILRWMV